MDSKPEFGQLSECSSAPDRGAWHGYMYGCSDIADEFNLDVHTDAG